MKNHAKNTMNIFLKADLVRIIKEGSQKKKKMKSHANVSKKEAKRGLKKIFPM